MIEIRRIYTKTINNHGLTSTPLQIVLADTTNTIKTKTKRGCLELTRTSPTEVQGRLILRDNTTGRKKAADGFNVVRGAYQTTKNELQIQFGSKTRFGRELLEGEIAFKNLSSSKDDVVFSMEISEDVAAVKEVSALTLEAQLAALNKEDLVALLAKAIQSNGDQAPAVNTKTQAAPVPAAKANKTRGGNVYGPLGLPLEKRRGIKKALKTMSVREVAATLGLSQITVRKYARG